MEAGFRVICDTDVLIDYLDERKGRHAMVRSVIDDRIGLENVVISAITRMELLMGERNRAGQTALTRKLRNVRHLLIDDRVCT